jgi:hypothetical protein
MMTGRFDQQTGSEIDGVFTKHPVIGPKIKFLEGKISLDECRLRFCVGLICKIMTHK